jgi:hypothetical protein
VSERGELFPLPSARFLTRPQAAAYLGVSVRTFDAEVTSGVWPAPMRRGGKQGALTWDRRLLDRAADRIGGLAESDAPGTDLRSAEQAALEAVARGTTTLNRHQHSHKKTV